MNDFPNMPQELLIPEDGETCYIPFSSFVRSRINGANEPNRTVWTINARNEDAHRTVIPAGALSLTRYKSNPIVLLNHYDNYVLGTSKVSKRKTDDGEEYLEAIMDDRDAADGGNWDLDDPIAVETLNKVKKGILKGASIGFQGDQWERKLRDQNGGDTWENTIMELKNGSLLEWSIVSVPSNPSTLVTSRMLAHDPTRKIFSIPKVITREPVPSEIRTMEPETVSKPPSDLIQLTNEQFLRLMDMKAQALNDAVQIFLGRK